MVWRTPDSIQLGVDHPLAVIGGLTPGLERVLSALRSGVPEDGAFMLGRAAGAADDEIAGLIRALQSALLNGTPPADAHPGHVHVDGTGIAADRIRDMLLDLGIPTAADDPDGAVLAVIVAHYVVDPRRHGRWLRRDIPHLPVVFSDTEVRFGPVVEPGAGPCLSCLELRHVDDDEHWPAMAVQLLARQAPTETPLLSSETANAVARLVRIRLVGSRRENRPLRPEPASGGSVSYAIDAETGTITSRVHQPHERCGCRSLPGSATAPADRAAALLTRPNSATDAAVPA